MLLIEYHVLYEIVYLFYDIILLQDEMKKMKTNRNKIKLLCSNKSDQIVIKSLS